MTTYIALPGLAVGISYRFGCSIRQADYSRPCPGNRGQDLPSRDQVGGRRHEITSDAKQPVPPRDLRSLRLRQPDIVNFGMLLFWGLGFPFLFPGRSYERSVSWLTASSAAAARGRSRPCGAGGWVCRRRDRRRRHQGSACRQSSRWLRACSRHSRWGWLAGAGTGGPRDRSRQRVSRGGQ